jgi:hypothetical protein
VSCSGMRACDGQHWQWGCEPVISRWMRNARTRLTNSFTCGNTGNGGGGRCRRAKRNAWCYIPCRSSPTTVWTGKHAGNARRLQRMPNTTQHANAAAAARLCQLNTMN